MKIYDEWEIISKEEYLKDITNYEYKKKTIDTCPDLWKMMEYCRENYIIPNITINGYGFTNEIVEKLAALCGGISVSCYSDKDVCFDAISRLSKAGCKTLNIHRMISEETYEESLNIVDDVKHDIRLKDLNAVVFLSLKKKGRGVTYNCLEYGKFKTLVEKCINNSIRYGFDSCGSSKAIQVFKELNMLSDVEQYIEPCESGVFSSYINVEGKYFPCSFLEESFDGMDMANYDSFLDIWASNEVKEWRTKLLCNGRNCPVFEV